MSPTIRKATSNDAPFLVRVIDMASGGVVPMLWAKMAPSGAHGSEVGLALVEAEDGDFSYRNGFIAERDGTDLGGLIGYILPITPRPPASDVPDVFVGIEDTSAACTGSLVYQLHGCCA